MFSHFPRAQAQEPEINSHLAYLMRIHNVSIAGYAIIDNYQIVAADTITTNLNKKVSTDSLFQSCSLSKSLTAYGILKLVDQEKLNLDKPLNKQLRSWQIPKSKFSDVISPRQCLSMTSGLSYGEPGATFPSYTQEGSLPTLNEILTGTKPANNHSIKQVYDPGARYSYSGAGYTVLQKLIEDITGQKFSEFMQQQILEPLKMHNSSFSYPEVDILKSNVVPGFKANGEMLKGGWDPIPTFASGGLWSTPLDLAHFILDVSKAYIGKEKALISQPMAFEMLNIQPNSIFGLGIVIDAENRQINFRKNGHNSGYHNELLMFPETGQGIVIMTNSNQGILVINDFIAFVAKRNHWPKYSLNFDELSVIPNDNLKKSSP